MKKLVLLIVLFVNLVTFGQVLTITDTGANTYIINGSSSGDILVASEADDNTVRLKNVTQGSSNDYKTTSGFTDFVIGGVNPSDVEDAVIKINAITNETIGADVDNYSGGFVNYNDSGISIPITVAGSPVILTNDGNGPQTVKTFLPAGVTDVWNTSTNQFDWTQLDIGDMVDIRLDVSVTTVSPNTAVEINLHLGTGEGIYTIPFITESNIKNVSTKKLIRFNGIYIGDSNTRDNGGQFEMSTDADCSVVINGWYVKIIKKG